VIHGVLVVAVHAQAAAAVTSTPVAPPAAVGVSVSGITVKAQPVLWLTVNVRPAIVAVPLRSAPVLAAIDSCTAPLPVPEAPAVTVIQGTFDAAVHAHPFPAVTLTVVDPPAALIPCCSGAMVNVQAVPCVTVNVSPATVSVPTRPGPVFGAAVKLTVPLPLPDAPLLIESQGALLIAVHAQPPGAVTPTEPVPPDVGTVWLVDDSENEQPLPCVTANVLSATLTLPVRDVPVFGATVSCTVPLPVPDAPEAIVIHGTWLAAVQPQPPAA
jgi:hypothetical protein